VGAALFRRRRLAGSALLGRRRLDFKRQTKTNGEQQIYVDPRYTGGRRSHWGSTPSRSSKAFSRSSPAAPRRLKPVLFNNGICLGHPHHPGWFAQKYDISKFAPRSDRDRRVAAFWLLADDGGWPPEIDVLEAASGPAIS